MTSCPFCKGVLPLTDVNVATDMAICRACNKELRYSDIAAHVNSEGFDPSKCPKHLTITPDLNGQGVTLTYKKISPIIFFLIPFAALWSGVSMSMIYGVPLYQYFTNGKPLGIGQLLFGIPFLLGTIVLLSVILYGLFGKIKLHLHNQEMTVFTGVGPLGWTKRATLTPQTRVLLKDSGIRVNNQIRLCIALEDNNNTILKMGSAYHEDLQKYVVHFLTSYIRNGLKRK